jgi:DNA adenine methylase
LIKQLEKLFPKEFNNYFEPFIGWWAVFFNIQKPQSFLSDINEELINAYQIVKTSPKKLIEFLETLENTKECYTKVRSWDREENWQKKYSDLERAWRFIYLNKTCFNWLHRVNSRWEFNVPMWDIKTAGFIQKENILNSSKLLKQTKAEIKVQSFEKVLDKAQNWDFVYFDPPYDTLTDTANFTSYNQSSFGRDMQTKLAEVYRELDKRWCKVMLSNHNTPFIRELYKWLKIKKLSFKIVQARRAINSKGSWRGEVEEIVVVNY